MRSKRWLLVRMLRTASGNGNILKYEKDAKKRRRAEGSIVGSIILHAIIAAVLILLTVGMGNFGMIQGVPAICALLISVLELIFGILRTGDYLFSKKDYEIITALPFSIRDQVSGRFIAMYIHNLPSTFVFSMAMMAGYGYFANPAFYVYIIWIILTFFIPLIPTVIASVIGVLSAGLSSGSKHKSVLQSVFIFIFTIVFIFAGQILGRLFDTSEKINAALTTISNAGETAGGAYLPVRWFSDAIIKTDPLSIILLIVVSAALFEVVFFIISKFYRRINSRMLTVKTEGRTYKMKKGGLKKRSVVRTIAYKEFRHFIGSSVYLTNTGIGSLIALILSVLVLVVDINWIFNFIVRGAPVQVDVLIPVVPMILFFFIGMAPTTVVSWSLEGKNFWILQSLPVSRKDICRGKMLFNLYVQVPFMVIGCICFGIALHVPFYIILLFLLCGIILCLYSTVFGMFCNLKHANMEWEKEVDVVKRGSAVMFYILPNLFITMAVIAICLFVGFYNGSIVTLLTVSAAYAGAAILFYLLIRKTVKQGKHVK